MNALGIAAAELQWPVFPCRGDKRPITANGFKDATHVREVILRQFANPAAQTIGTPTGRVSGLVAVDVDVKNGQRGAEWLDTNKSLLPKTRMHRTVSGGLHLLFRMPADVEIRNSASRIAPGVDIRGEGGYIIVPPSPGYAVADPVEPADMPDWLVQACLKPEPKPATEPLATPSQPASASAESDLGRYANRALDDAFNRVRNAPEGTRNPTLNNEALSLATMLWWNEFSRSTIESVLGRAATEAGLGAVEIQKTLASAIDAGLTKPQRPKPEQRDIPGRPPEPPPHTEYPEQHRQQSAPNDPEVDENTSSTPDDGEAQEDQSADPEPEPEPEPEPDQDQDLEPSPKAKAGRKTKPEADKAKAADTPEKELPAWAKYLQTDDKGQILSNLANALQALRNAPEMTGLLAYDEMMRQLMFTRSIGGCKIKDARDLRAVEDAEVTALQEWLQRHNIRRVAKETVQQAVELIGREHAFHPVKDYLTGVRWDGVKRLDGSLASYFGCSEQPAEYLSHIGRWFFISLVARVFDPGCKCDYMIVLEGEQGVMKSTACSVIGGKWFDDAVPAIKGGDDVRVSQHLRGKWLIEIGELSSIRKAEAEALKTFVTRRDERYIAKYGRNEVHEPRQCVFIGTTNMSQYLADETGGRRFWPVKVGTIDIDALKRDRDQFFAEAVVAYKAREQYWPDREFEGKFIKKEQEGRFIDDAWEGMIDTWLGKERQVTTVPEIAEDMLGIRKGDLNKADQGRIAAILKRLGFRAMRDAKGRWWQRGDTNLGRIVADDNP
jgi:predicted P-loop ATPase